MPNRILTSAGVDAWSQEQLAREKEMLKAHYTSVPGSRCALMPSVPHCFHEQLELWSDLFPPALICCWCGQENADVAAVPHRHGPYVPTS